MTSFGASKIISNIGFKPTFKVQGQIYHQIGSLLPPPDEDYKFIFMGDEEKEVIQRCAISRGIRREIVFSLQQLFHENNCFVKFFNTTLEKVNSSNYRVIIRADKKPSGEHERRFNTPTTNDVAIVMVGTEFEKRDIVIDQRNSGLQRVCETHRSYDALQYPVIFLEGQDGYHFGIMQTNPVTGEPSMKKVG